MKKKMLALCLSLALCISLIPTVLAAEDETYLITITTADGVVTSGYRGSWRWVCTSRTDTGHPSIPLSDYSRRYDYVGGPELKRSDEGTPSHPATQEALIAWGKALDGTSATLTMGNQSWEVTARYQDYSTPEQPNGEKLLDIEFLPNENGYGYNVPDHDTKQLFRYAWVQADDQKYRAAVEDLQSLSCYQTEQSFDSPYGTVFIYNQGTTPHGDHGFLRLICKAPCAKGAGAVVPLPHPRHGVWGNTKPPLTAELNEDKKTFTYTYHFDEPLVIYGRMDRPAGDFIYTVDLTTGEVTAQEPPIPEGFNTYAASLEREKTKEGWTVEQTLEAPGGTLLLRYMELADGRRSYFLDLVCKVQDDSYDCEEGSVRDLNLPATKNDGPGLGGFPVWYTHKAPDSLTLNADGTELTYSYAETMYGPTTETIKLPSAPLSAAPAAQAEELAGKLKALGLFLGDGNGNFDLDRTPTRVEALVMLIRALGEESQAKGLGKTHPFTDVPAWADGYVSWGYAKGYTNGISDTEFGGNTPASSEMYLTFLLRALGYDEGNDFTWDKPFYPAYRAGVLPSCVDFGKFLRSDVVEATVAALFAQEKERDSSLHQRLEAAGSFTAEDFAAAFPADPYAYEKSLTPLVDAACDYYFETGQENNVAKAQTNLILNQYTGDGVTTVVALVCSAYANLYPYGGSSGSHKYYGLELRFDAHTGELLERHELPHDDPAWTIAVEGVGYVPKLDGCLDLAAWHLLDQAEYIPGSYEEEVALLRGGMGHSNEQTFETDECTVFVYDRGGFMNAPSGAMTVIYKAGSQLGEGHRLDLPHVRSGWSVTPADAMNLDLEKGTFTYSYFYETSAYDSSIQSYDTRVEPGIFTFTVDLPTGEVHREYRPMDYAGALAHVTRKRIISSNEHSEDREVVQTLETSECTAVLTKGRFVNKYDDYILSLVYKPGSALGDGTIKRLLLPSTVYDKGYSWYVPTDRAPDSLELSGDGKTLTYVYRFDEALEDYHDAGTYTYTVDLTTGELSVTHTAN